MNLSALMQGIENGDKKAFADLCEHFKQSVFDAALARTENAEDAKQIRKAVFKEMYSAIRAKGPYAGDVLEWLLGLTDKHVRILWHQRIQSALEQPSPTGDMPAMFDAPSIDPDPAAPPPVDPAVLTKQYSNAEARELEARADARLFSGNVDDEYDGDNERASIFSLAALAVLTLLLAWMMIGFLSSLEILPELDLGYTWFNETVFRLF